MTWLQALVLVVYVVLGLSILVQIKQFNSNHVKQLPTDPPEFNDRLKQLARERLIIEKMPAGYQKVKCQEQWLSELNALLGNSSKDRQVHPNVVNIEHFKR